MNDLFHETELMMTRRQLFGRSALGLGTFRGRVGHTRCGETLARPFRRRRSFGGKPLARPRLLHGRH